MTKPKTECPKNSEVANAIVAVLSKGEALSSKDVKAAVIKRLRLNEHQLAQTTSTGNGNRFTIRFSTQLSNLLKAGALVKREDKLIEKAAEQPVEQAVEPVEAEEGGTDGFQAQDQLEGEEELAAA